MWFQSAQGGAEGNEVQPCLSRPEACVQQLAFGGWWAGHLFLLSEGRQSPLHGGIPHIFSLSPFLWLVIKDLHEHLGQQRHVHMKTG